MRSKRRSVKGEVLLEGEQQRRHEARQRRIRWWRIGAVLAVVSVFAGLIALYFSPLLRVQNVEVAGASTVSAEEVAALLDVEGDSMLRVNTTKIVERLSELPMVYRASVERAWPQTVRIKITERSPWGYWKSGDNIYSIDLDGVVLSGVTPPDGAPVIEDADGAASLSPGDRVDKDATFLTQLLLDHLPQSVTPAAGTVRYSAETGLSLETSAGYRVVIGDSQNFGYKLAVWQALEQELGPESMIGYVLDLRFGDRPSLTKGGDES